MESPNYFNHILKAERKKRLERDRWSSVLGFLFLFSILAYAYLEKENIISFLVQEFTLK